MVRSVFVSICLTVGMLGMNASSAIAGPGDCDSYGPGYMEYGPDFSNWPYINYGPNFSNWIDINYGPDFSNWADVNYGPDFSNWTYINYGPGYMNYGPSFDCRTSRTCSQCFRKSLPSK